MFLPSNKQTPLKVAIIRTSAIGDVVLASSCINLLENIGVSYELYWVGKSPSLELLKSSFPKIHAINLEQPAQSPSVSELIKDCDLLIDLQSNLRSHKICLSFKQKTKKPYYRCPKRRIYRSKLVLEAHIKGRRRQKAPQELSRKNLQHLLMSSILKKALLENLPSEFESKIKESNPRPKLDATQSVERSPWLLEIESHRWLAVSCGASYDTKKAPLEKFAQIISFLHEKASSERGKVPAPFGLLLVGDHKDRSDALKLLELLGWNDPVLNLAGQLSLWETTQALSRAKVLLTNDSSLAHISEAVGTNVCVLFGPTVEEFGFSPWRKTSLSLSTNLGCRPCSKHGKTPCRYKDKRCFTQLPSQQAGLFLHSNLFNESQQESSPLH